MGKINEYTEGTPATGVKLLGSSESGAKETLQYDIDALSEYFNVVGAGGLANRIIVNQSNVETTLGGTIDSTKEYYIDGDVDPSAIQVDLSGGKVLNIAGGGTNVSKLISSTNNYTMIIGDDAGEIMFTRVTLTIGGTNSGLMDVTSNTGNEALSFITVNFDFCTSLGEARDYNQGLEIITRRFGGTPQLTLSGTWGSGYFIDTSIVRNLTDGAYSLFKEGTGFTMASRFKSNQNVDLPASVSFLDFQSSNFLNPSTLQLSECIITRNGTSDASDSNITPNISSIDIASSWKGNNGLPNTFVGGTCDVTTEVTTTITTPGAFVDLLGTTTSSDLQHFDSPSDGQLRHLGESPIEYKLSGQYVIDSNANDEVDLKVVIFRFATTSFEDSKTIRRVINNLQGGGRDVGYFVLDAKFTLNKFDFVKVQGSNVFASNDITAEKNSFYTVSER